MARQLQPCGTYAAYRRHLRNGEEACDLCKQAYRDYQNDRNGYGAGLGTPGHNADRPGAGAGEVPTPREDAVENLRLVTEAMTKAAPNALPALSKRRQELVEYLNAMDTKGEGGLAEQIAAARAERERRRAADT